MRARSVRMFSAEGPTDATVDKPDEFGWWDWTVFLLHTAAEVEHALLVQYLYAAYSLPTSSPMQRTITGIAKEEMGHLLTVQNLLRFIGGPLNFEREDFPIRTFLYPFPLRLEPLSKTSLAKYVTAEMPAEAASSEEIQEIVALATAAAGGMGVNRVGVVYDALAAVFADGAKLPDTDFRPDTAGGAQGNPQEWFAFGGLIVRAVRTRGEAVAALRAVGEQGEGSGTPPAGAPKSHFDKFLEIYRTFPETSPALAIPVDPNTRRVLTTDATLERGRITHPTTRLWAHLFNVRYRMSLLDLSHALHVTGPLREDLRDWTFAEMRALRGLARKLVTLPLKETPAEGDAPLAGPPFELPFTLALPDNERDRWRTHRALLDTSKDLIARIAATGDTSPLLTDLADADAAALPVVAAQLA
ncbi:MAG: ferritin-like domain-containing protein [Acidimicrobiales bacterium]